MPDHDYLSVSEAQEAGLLGSDPLPDMRYLLAPILTIPAPKVADVGPSDASDFVAAARKADNAVWSADETQQAWAAWGDWQAKAALGFPKLWAQIVSNGQAHWEPLTGSLPRAPSGKLAAVTGLALTWELTALLSVGAAQEAQELARNMRAAGERVSRFGWTLAPNETPEDAARRAERLIKWKTHFARPVEMRLIPHTPFWAQSVWRCAYALGMEWTSPFGGENRARFVWPARSVGPPLFFVGVSEAHGLLTPEKATPSETVPGLVFYFELPPAPAPVETFERMVLALNYFAHTLNGRPVSAGGINLDGDALDALRGDLEETVREMEGLGLAPGSPEAARFF